MFTHASLEAARVQYAEATDAVQADVATSAPSYILHRAGFSVTEALRQSGLDERAVAEIHRATYGVLIGRLASVEEVYLASDPALHADHGERHRRPTPSRALPAPMDRVQQAWSAPISSGEYDSAVEQAVARADGRKPAAFVRQPWRAGNAASAVAYEELLAGGQQVTQKADTAASSGLSKSSMPQPATE